LSFIPRFEETSLALVSDTRIVGLMILFIIGQVDPPGRPAPGSHGSREAPVKSTDADSSRVEAEVAAEHLDVFDQPEDTAYITGELRRGDRVRVRVGRTPGMGWVAIDPLPTAFCWIEQSALELEDEKVTDALDRGPDPIGQDAKPIWRAWVNTSRAVIRSGHPQARLPGPPRGSLPKGTMVQLVDRPPLKVGQGAGATPWLAIVPASNQVSYIHADGVRFVSPIPSELPVAEVRAAYEKAIPSARGQVQGRRTDSSPSWPPEVAFELERIDGMYRATIAGQSLEQWRFEAVRAAYQALLKRVGDCSDLEEALRSRLARVTQHEQAAQAARTIESIFAKSHRRDRQVSQVKQDLSRAERARARAYDAIGFVQPSARKVDGHKIFALIGSDGSTIAYLDIPPGLDSQPLLARRVGIRGRAHFSEDLGSRLITVRDMESIEASR
jgi:hypothetical protein